MIANIYSNSLNIFRSTNRFEIDGDFSSISNLRASYRGLREGLVGGGSFVLFEDDIFSSNKINRVFAFNGVPT